MSTLTEIESAVPLLTARELAELERVVRAERMKKTKARNGRSILNLPPLNLGQMLRPLGTRDEWHDVQRLAVRKKDEFCTVTETKSGS